MQCFNKIDNGKFTRSFQQLKEYYFNKMNKICAGLDMKATSP